MDGVDFKNYFTAREDVSSVADEDSFLVHRDSDGTIVELPASDLIDQVTGDLSSQFVSAFAVDAVFGDGTTDATAHIQDKIDAAEAAGGGLVFIPPGNYVVTALVIDSANVTLRGAGPRSTRLLAKSTIVGAVLRVKAMNTVVADLWIDGNKANAASGTYCLHVEGGSRSHYNDLYLSDSKTVALFVGSDAELTPHANKYTNIWVMDAGTNGIQLMANGYDSQLTNIWIGPCAATGLYILSGAQRITNLHVWGCAVDGIRIDGTMTNISNVFSEHNTSYGIRLQGVGNTITGGRLWANGVSGAAFAAGGQRNVLSGLIVDGNGESTDSPGVGISDDFNIVTGCQFFDVKGTKTQTYGVSIFSGGQSNIITNNMVIAADHKTGSTSNSGGASNVFANNVTS